MWVSLTVSGKASSKRESLANSWEVPEQGQEKGWAYSIASCSFPAQTPGSSAASRRRHRTLHPAGLLGAMHLLYHTHHSVCAPYTLLTCTHSLDRLSYVHPNSHHVQTRPYPGLHAFTRVHSVPHMHILTLQKYTHGAHSLNSNTSTPRYSRLMVSPER